MRISDWSSDVCSSDHFTNQLESTGNPDGKGVLRIWDTTVNLTGGWVYLSGTENLIQYGGWNSIELLLIPEQSKVEYYFNGSLVHTWVDPTSYNGSEPGQFFALYLKARNNCITDQKSLVMGKRGTIGV